MPRPHFILSLRNFKETNGSGTVRRTEASGIFGFDDFWAEDSLDEAQPETLGMYSSPEYARRFGWQRLLDDMKARGFEPAEVCLAEQTPMGQCRVVSFAEALDHARKAPHIAPAQEPAHA